MSQHVEPEIVTDDNLQPFGSHWNGLDLGVLGHCLDTFGRKATKIGRIPHLSGLAVDLWRFVIGRCSGMILGSKCVKMRRGLITGLMVVVSAKDGLGKVNRFLEG